MEQQIISGTITSADQGTPPDQNSNIYQNITITDNTGQMYTGRIGSKGGYAINAPIQVTYEMRKSTGGGADYMYFHKYNPKYPNDHPAQGSPPRQQSAPRQQAPQQQQQAPRQAYSYPDAKDIAIIRQSSIKAAVRCNCSGPAEAILIAKQFENYVLSRASAPPAQAQSPQGNEPQTGQDHPDPVADGSDVPF